MTRSASTLAALADAAVAGLYPHLVEEFVDRVGERFRVGFVEDTQGRRWVVRVPGDAVSAAQLGESGVLASILSGRLPFAIPSPVGVAPLRDGRRAVVYPLITGRCVSFAALPPDPGPATRIAVAIAQVHNLDPQLFDDAGVPSYSADDCRRRRQSDVDRGAATGLVPTGLLSRWERMLDDVSWWRFASVPVHGHLQEDHLLIRFDDEEDIERCRVVGMTSWENAQIADPAQDLAALLAQCPRDTARAVLRTYARARHETPDPHLTDRANLLAELEYLSELLTARRLGDRSHLTQATEALRRLDDVVSTSGSGNRSGTAVDKLPVDFSPDPADENWYRAGTPATGPVTGTQSVVYRAGERPPTPAARIREESTPPAESGEPAARPPSQRAPAAAPVTAPGDGPAEPSGPTPGATEPQTAEPQTAEPQTAAPQSTAPQAGSQQTAAERSTVPPAAAPQPAGTQTASERTPAPTAATPPADSPKTAAERTAIPPPATPPAGGRPKDKHADEPGGQRKDVHRNEPGEGHGDKDGEADRRGGRPSGRHPAGS